MHHRVEGEVAMHFSRAGTERDADTCRTKERTAVSPPLGRATQPAFCRLRFAGSILGRTFLASRFGKLRERRLDLSVQIIQLLNQIVVARIEPVQQFLRGGHRELSMGVPNALRESGVRQGRRAVANLHRQARRLVTMNFPRLEGTVAFRLGIYVETSGFGVAEREGREDLAERAISAQFAGYSALNAGVDGRVLSR